MRLANLIVSNLATFLLLMAYWRPNIRLCLEQPKSSWLFKQVCMREVIQRFNLVKTLTYQGDFGAPLLKGTHLMANFSLKEVARKATTALKKKHAAMVAKRNRRRQQKGLQIKEYYVHLPGQKFQGTKHLTETSVYPLKFVNAIFRCWLVTLALPAE